MRAFIAVRVPENKKLTDVIKALGKIPGMKTAEPKELHITLKFLGEINEKQKNDVSAFLETLGGFGHFEIKVKGIGVFPNEHVARVVWAGAESKKLNELNELIENGTEKLGFMREKRAFSPHITLARAKTNPSEGLKRILTQEDFFSFEAGSILLIESVPSRESHKYFDVKTVEL
ncbi:MAG: RNA 2',3'-cyclic phosphodiesterase [archaeon]